MPGDVVMGTPTGVSFIPSHLAAAVAQASRDIAVREVFGKERIAARKYSTAEIDVPEWPIHIEQDFQAWLATVSAE